jgi:hypothetical protein
VKNETVELNLYQPKSKNDEKEDVEVCYKILISGEENDN